MDNRPSIRLPRRIASLFFSVLLFGGCREQAAEPLPAEYELEGAYIHSLLLHFNHPDSCAMLIRRDVPPRWQGIVCENLYKKGPEDSPLSLGFQHLDCYEKNFPDDSVREMAQLWRGLLYIHQRKIDSARICLQDCYDSSTRHQRLLRASDAKVFLARSYLNAVEITKATKMLFEVYDALKDLDSTQNERKARVAQDISTFLSIGKEFKQALLWQQRSWGHSSSGAGWARECRASSLGSFASLYNELNQPDSALLMARQALDNINGNPSLSTSRAYLIFLMGKSYLVKGDCPTAHRYLLKAKHTNNSRDGIPQMMYNEALAESYFCLGRLDSAEVLYKACLAWPDSAVLPGIHLQLGEVYARRGDAQNALSEFRQGFVMRHNLFTAEKAKEMSNLQVQLELERQQRLSVESEARRKTARQQSLIIALSGLLALGFALSLFFRQRSRSRILVQEKQLAEASEHLKILELERAQAALKNTQDELDATTQLLALKNQFIEAMEMRLSHRHLAPAEGMAPGSAGNNDMRSMKILTDADWTRFRERFEQHFPGFLQYLKTRHSSLTAAEIRLFLLMKMSFDTHEISGTLGISKDSVWRSRHRLTKKLGLPETGNLDTFVRKFG